MTIDELKDAVEKYKVQLKKQPQHVSILSNQTGPIDIGVVERVVAAMETLNERISKLEKKR